MCHIVLREEETPSSTKWSLRSTAVTNPTRIHEAVAAPQLQTQLGSMRMQVRSLTSISRLRIRHCCELWCRSQTWLGSSVAVAVVRLAAGARIRPLAWVQYAVGCSLKKQKKTNKKPKWSLNAGNNAWGRTDWRRHSPWWWMFARLTFGRKEWAKPEPE